MKKYIESLRKKYANRSFTVCQLRRDAHCFIDMRSMACAVLSELESMDMAHGTNRVTLGKQNDILGVLKIETQKDLLGDCI